MSINPEKQYHRLDQAPCGCLEFVYDGHDGTYLTGPHMMTETMTSHATDQPWIEYDSEADRYRIDVLPGHSAATTAVIAIARVAGVDPVDMKPLHDSVDPELLESLHRAATDDAIRFDGEVTVSVDEYLIVVETDGTLSVEPSE